MGKKKKHGKHGAGRDGEHRGGGLPLAGIATMVASQVNSPAGRQAIAAGLRMAADALGGPRAPQRPPVPPVADVPPEPPRADAPPSPPGPPPRADVPPEVARVIGSVAAGLERWAAKMGTPKK